MQSNKKKEEERKNFVLTYSQEQTLSNYQQKSFITSLSDNHH